MKKIVKYLVLLLIPLLQAFGCCVKPYIPIENMFWVVKNNTNQVIYVYSGMVYITHIQGAVAIGNPGLVTRLQPQEEFQIHSYDYYYAQNNLPASGFHAFPACVIEYDLQYKINRYPKILTVDDWSFWVATSPNDEFIKSWKYGDRGNEDGNFFNENSWEYIYNEVEQTHTWVFHIQSEDLTATESL